MTRRYTVAEPHVVRREPLVVEWVVKPGAPVRETRVAVKAAYMRALDPALSAAPDAFASTHFDRAARAGLCRCVPA